MLDILATVRQWRRAGQRVALATLIDVTGSAPRTIGAAVVVNERGDVAGSISGGCVESDVYEAAQACIAGDAPRTITYGISDGDARENGLTCGGRLGVFVRALTIEDDAAIERLWAAVQEERPMALAVRLDPPHAGRLLTIDDVSVIGTLGSTRLDAAIREEMRAIGDRPCAQVRTYGAHGEPLRDEATVFVQSFAPKPDMFVFGAVDFSRAMASMGRFLGYRVTVVDARPVFATAARIPDADRIVVAWPDEFLAAATVRASTVLVVLTHDLKFDVPLLRLALESDAGYIGVMGSRRTHAARIAALREAGVAHAGLARLHAPVGLDIGAHSPEETAISIAAEIVATRNGRRGGFLRDGVTPLHGPGLAVARVCEALQPAQSA
jgi:xanthine dehydrogenase accessory factor